MPYTDENDQESADILSRDEIAAVHVQHQIYVNDVPSPYLSERLAAESVDTTRRRHTIISTAFVLVLLGAMLAAAGWFVWDTIKPPETKAVPKYNTATIERKEFVDSIDATTIVLPIDEQPVITQMSGTITEMMVEDGAYVEEGQVLYTLDNPVATETLEKAQAALDVAQEDVDRRSAALDEAKKALEKQQRGGSSQDGSSQSSSSSTDQTTSSSTSTSSQGSTSSTTSNATLITAADARVQAAQKDLDDANARLDSVRETFDHAQEQVDHLTVQAPISGTIHDINLEYGPSVAIGGSEQLAVISDYSSFLVSEEVPAERTGQVQEGLEARLTFPSIRDLYFSANVTNVRESGNGTTQIADIVIENPDERIVANMACNVAIIIQSIPGQLIIPIESITPYPENPSSGQILLLIDASRGIKTPVAVNIIATSETEVAIESPQIQEGSSVVLSSPTTESAEQTASTPEEPETGEPSGEEGEPAAEEHAEESAPAE